MSNNNQKFKLSSYEGTLFASCQLDEGTRFVHQFFRFFQLFENVNMWYLYIYFKAPGSMFCYYGKVSQCTYQSFSSISFLIIIYNSNLFLVWKYLNHEGINGIPSIIDIILVLDKRKTRIQEIKKGRNIEQQLKLNPA